MEVRETGGLGVRCAGGLGEGAPEVSFRDRVVSYVRSQKPMYGEMSGMDSEWFDWGEEEYRALRERVRPY